MELWGRDSTQFSHGPAGHGATAPRQDEQNNSYLGKHKNAFYQKTRERNNQKKSTFNVVSGSPEKRALRLTSSTLAYGKSSLAIRIASSSPIMDPKIFSSESLSPLKDSNFIMDFLFPERKNLGQPAKDGVEEEDRSQIDEADVGDHGYQATTRA